MVVWEGAWDVVWEGALLLGAPTLPTSRQLSVLPILASTAPSSLLVKQKNCTEINSSFPGKGGLGKKKNPCMNSFLFSESEETANVHCGIKQLLVSCFSAQEKTPKETELFFYGFTSKALLL